MSRKWSSKSALPGLAGLVVALLAGCRQGAFPLHCAVDLEACEVPWRCALAVVGLKTLRGVRSRRRSREGLAVFVGLGSNLLLNTSVVSLPYFSSGSTFWVTLFVTLLTFR